MEEPNIIVERYDPALGVCVPASYFVPLKDGITVLQVLLYISETYDTTLAFRYGCRATKCGECAVDVNGRPRLACLTPAREGMTISPLKHLRPIRDIIVDRAPLDERISELRLYVKSSGERPLGALKVPESYERLIGCLECYGCVSSCPQFDWKKREFGGPYVFVRLAQLHLDPRDGEDRRAQARSLGIERCSSCSQCTCVKGIAIRRDAIGTLLGEGKA
ncbi:MAG: hypothetical protein C4532_08650 [Candidatus Abyssobacteria bacterium SURF_17]|jgi:succinate dehydrogenase/fumarate reductase iron-sulfur protein|uniref:succinate dehydrogenase n=1 Tax=Candidatus Abyssobacteria bacterium SURF_17 TaxID=2093361 RepID=A0A419EZF0_9BACT|nr:MAG: hypothetical protein C4532_08650 [Candidatus Abyssubacteria bacterium SURF_17]